MSLKSACQESFIKVIASVYRMKEEIEKWWKQTLNDVEVAHILFHNKKYDYGSFWCQQAAEKALKTLLLQHGHELIKTHDLVLLARKVTAPEDIIQLCKELTPVYIETRYPALGDEGFKEFTKKETEEDIQRMEKIVQWVKKNL